jgi:hypothetical protein
MTEPLIVQKLRQTVDNLVCPHCGKPRNHTPKQKETKK